MQTDTLTFNKGMNPDIDVHSMENGMYISAENMMLDDSGNIVTEHGIRVVHELGSNYKVVGVCIIEEDIVVLSTDDTNSEIGILNNTNTYTTLVNNIILGFKKENKVRTEFKIDYKGDRVIYVAGKGIKLRAINIDNIPTSDFGDSTNLFLEYDLPVVSADSVTSGGSILSGIYQFAARLVTAGNNTTAFGPISGLIPIGTGTSSSSRKDIDGAEPQTVTSKSISLDIKNIDTTFEYIELCVITYTGQANTLNIKSLGLQPILSRNEITLTYTGPSDESDTILEEELAIDGTYYESAEYITQKDSTLELAGLTEKEDTTDWQEVANRIVLKYVEHNLEHYEVIDMAKDGETSWNSLSDDKKKTDSGNNSATWTDIATAGSLKDFKNPIVASKFRGYRRDEVYSFTFTPIFKGGRRGDAYHIPALTSSEVENLGISTDNLLSVAQTKTTTYPNGFGELSNQLVRYHKMPSTEESPFYIKSGTTQYVVALGVDSIITGDQSWKEDLDGYIIGRENRTGKETIAAQGFSKDIYEIGDGDEYTFAPSFGNCEVRGTDKTNIVDATKYDKKVFTFHSPDITINPDISYVPTSIKRIMQYDTEFAYANTSKSSRKQGFCMLVCNPGTVHGEQISLINGVKSINSLSDDILDNPREVTGGVNLSVDLFNKKVSYRRTLECIGLNSEEDLPRNRDFIDYFSDDSDSTTATYRLSSVDNFGLDLYNLEIQRDEYYGDVFNKESIPINTIIFSQGSKNPITDGILADERAVSFGGDTFISRYALELKTTGAFLGTVGNDQDIPKTNVLVYMMVESNNNYNYRHYIENTDTESFVPYYPKFRTVQQEDTGILNLPVAVGVASSYNKQYSTQNLLKPNYTKDIGTDRVETFANRIAYSATSIEGEKFDAYRLFLPANYHDIPKQFGPITGMFVQGSDLFVHTKRSLWKTFFNALVTQVTSAGDIVLGNGGAFNRPSIPVIPIDGGYAGCKDISASVSTPAGRYFYDAYRCKLFYLGNNLKEVSHNTVESLFRENLYNKDTVLGYDYGRKRVILSEDNFTISYKPNMNSFASKHSYNFNEFSGLDIKEIAFKNNLIGVVDSSLIGSYFGTVYNSKLQIPSTVGPNISKRYTSMFVVSSGINKATGLQNIDKFFSSLKAYSQFRNTGYNDLNIVNSYLEDLEELGKINVYKVNNKYRLDIPPDIVNDIYQDIHNAINLKTHASFSDLDRMYLPDMIGEYMIFEFNIDNSDNNEMKVITINANFEQNIS